MKSLVAVVLTLAVTAGCGGGSPSTRTLTTTDVSNIPPGDAVGTMLSGSYLVVSESIEGCVCRVGSCSNVHGESEIGATQVVTQQDGALSLVDSGYRTDAPLLGRVDADSKFSVGGALQIPSYLGQGVIYSLRTGTFSVSGGVPTGMEYTIDASIKGSITPVSYDCDIHAFGSTRYEGP